MDSTDQIPALADITLSGGRLNIAAALAYSQDFSITVAPLSQSVSPGESAIYTVTITSLGDTTEQITLSLDTLDSGITAHLADTQLTPPVGGSISTSLTVTAAADIARGDFFVRILAADDSDEVFSSTTATLKVLRPTVDLVISSVSTPDSQVHNGATISVTHTTKNTGSSSTDSYFWVGIYLSSDATITTADTRIGTRYVHSLLGGGTVTRTTSVNIPAGLAAGTYYLGAIADFNDWQTESNENNNVRVANPPLQVSKDIDLLISSVSTPDSSAYTGARISVTHILHNAGDSSSDSIFRVGVYLSSDATITTADTRIGTRYIHHSLPGGSYSSWTATAYIPPGLAAGTYYLGAIADYTDRQTESNENNNVHVATTPVQVIKDIDLLVSSVSTPDSQAYTGTRINVTYTTQNAGGSTNDSSFHVGIYLSSDATITTADTRIGWRFIQRLPGGISSTVTTSPFIPSGLAAGTYYLGAIADDLDQQAETDESNNGLTAAIPLNID
ncbi:MAG: hypothetical protein L3K24_16505 [Gammaproteobacteria bacterium]|nr:hypothetical protein [Gammaproteobacteria bacterium]